MSGMKSEAILVSAGPANMRRYAHDAPLLCVRVRTTHPWKKQKNPCKKKLQKKKKKKEKERKRVVVVVVSTVSNFLAHIIHSLSLSLSLYLLKLTNSKALYYYIYIWVLVNY